MVGRTFIIGAGVTMPFGFPSGKKLVELIVSRQHLLTGRGLEGDNYRRILRICKIEDSAETTRQFFIDLANSGMDSIDKFLSNQPEYKDIGKVAIAYEILTLERPGKIRMMDISDKESHKNAFRHIWNSLPGKDHIQELLSQKFIVFNYDRMLEHFLYSCFVHGLGKSSTEAMDMLNQVGIVHVYGQVGVYNPNTIGPELHTAHKDFADTVGPLVRDAASALKLMTEERADPQTEVHITELLHPSREVVVLGFGYDHINCKLLRRCRRSAIDEHQQEHNQAFASRILGSAMDLKRQQRESVYKRLGIDNRYLGDFGDNDVEFMKDHIEIFT